MSRQGFGPAETSAFARRKPPDPLLLERLAETGFLATECGMDEHAERIFLCLAKLKPGKPAPLIALAMVQARKGFMDRAIGDLRQVIAEHPESELAKAVLGTMLVHIREPGAREFLEDLLAHGTDQGALGVANCCIELAREQQAPAADPSSEAVQFFRHYNIRA